MVNESSNLTIVDNTTTDMTSAPTQPACLVPELDMSSSSSNKNVQSKILQVLDVTEGNLKVNLVI